MPSIILILLNRIKPNRIKPPLFYPIPNPNPQSPIPIPNPNPNPQTFYII